MLFRVEERARPWICVGVIGRCWGVMGRPAWVGVMGRWVGVIGRCWFGVMGRPVVLGESGAGNIGLWGAGDMRPLGCGGFDGRRIPGGGGPIGRPFGGGPCGRGLTGSLDRQVRGVTPCFERSIVMQRAWGSVSRCSWNILIGFMLFQLTQPSSYSCSILTSEPARSSSSSSIDGLKSSWTR